MIEKKDGIGFFGEIGVFLDKFTALVTTIVGTVILAFSTNLVSNKEEFLDYKRINTIVEWGGIILFVTGTFLQTRNTFKISRLETENGQLLTLLKGSARDYIATYEAIAIQIFNEIKLGNNSRISIYRHDGSNFIMLSRYSPDAHKKSKGRGYYPDNEGCIGHAYSNKECIEVGLPDPGTPEYFKIMEEKWHLKKEIVSKFTLHARDIAAFAIENKAKHNRPMVIVFESTEPNTLNEHSLRKICDRYTTTLCGITEAHESLLPSMAFAKEKGF
ncbi:hypothetical protein PWG14_24970 [Chromobacterium amazonense]|uniref:hypothetical protein n=1 Tax=Chromobacterium amazonense TaxID=1382803 RepID=UPI00237E412E|nr:hypothetical protein [Chromobacterium amazonense]MDE1715722.1 hypothetical protein [Chromobacterium amazonense]